MIEIIILTLSSGHTACLQGPAKATVPISLLFNVLFPFLHKHALIYLNWHSNLCPIKSQKITRKCYLWIPSSSSSILHSGLPAGMYHSVSHWQMWAYIGSLGLPKTHVFSSIQGITSWTMRTDLYISKYVKFCFSLYIKIKKYSHGMALPWYRLPVVSFAGVPYLNLNFWHWMPNTSLSVS